MMVFHFFWTQVSRKGNFKKLEVIKDNVLKYSCIQCGHQVTERYKLKQHTKFQAISYTVKYFYEKAVGLYEIMPTQDPWNSQY